MTSKTTQDAQVLALYIKAGIMLTPCIGNTTLPAKKGFQNTPYDPSFRPATANYQAILSHRIMVIDVDRRAFKPGDKPLSRLFKDLQIDGKTLMSNTFVVATPSKGYHIYFSKPENMKVKQHLKDYPGLEFKDRWIMAAGSYRIMPKKPEGAYSIHNGTPANLAPIPNVLLALLIREDRVDIVKEGLVSNHASNIKAFIQFCQTTEPAIENQNGDSRTYNVACVGKGKGLSRDKTLEIMLQHFNPRCVPQWDVVDMTQKVENSYAFGHLPLGAVGVEADFDEPPQNEPTEKIGRWDKFKNGSYKITRNNLSNILFKIPAAPCRNLFQFNDFSHTIELTKRPLWRKEGATWDDSDAIQLAQYISDNHAFEANINMIHETVHAESKRKSYHPVKDYLNSITFDTQNPILNNWLSVYCGAPDTRYTRFVGRKMLIAAVARIFNPGIKFDHVPVLEGKQGIGKSLLCATLSSPWFSDAHFDVRDKDSIALLQGHWIIELAEMSVLTKSAVENLKAFITRQVDKMRPAYGRTVQSFPRQCIFIGTINPENQGYLRDPTGNRRFWPVPIETVDVLKLRDDRDQLWAEAYYYYKRGEDIHVPDRETQLLIEREIIKRQQEDPWFEVVEQFIDNNYSDYIEGDACVILPSELYVNALEGKSAKITSYEASRISNILVRLGFERLIDIRNKRTSKYTKPVEQFL
ncbi:MAG: bifunctional DNA primase/polymerase [Deltaproteobacteria bacterium]|nr:bifunctional DNA primase/polymerase [Deltaproteobacteria bacterium]